MELNKISEGNTVIIEFNGNLILSDLEKARKYVKDVVDGDDANLIIFDLTNVEFIDSAGIGFVVSVFKSVKTKNGKFALASLKSKPHEVFKLTRLDKIIPIYENAEAAKQDLL